MPLCGALCAAQVGLGGWGFAMDPAPDATDSSESIHAHVDVGVDDDDDDDDDDEACRSVYALAGVSRP